MTHAIDEAKLGELMGRMVGHMTGGAMRFGIWLGDEHGLYRVLAAADELTAGYAHFRRAAETPLNLILEARA